jgi:hypothetical protein
LQQHLKQQQTKLFAKITKQVSITFFVMCDFCDPLFHAVHGCPCCVNICKSYTTTHPLSLQQHLKQQQTKLFAKITEQVSITFFVM